MYGTKSEANLLQNKFLFCKELPTLAPRAEFFFDLEACHVDFESEDNVNPSVINVHATYEWSNQTFEEDTSLDFRTFIGSNAPSSAALEEMKKLNENILKLISTVKNLHTP